MPTPTNRLIHSNSPYLLQHAHNPVDWHPWGPEALAEARRREVPIFLSVGYSACHWCHVMERESFEDPGVAEVLNANFVAIKVDREERPDLDELYMSAVHLMGLRGGWPLSVWLTPDLRPFYGGTYFPPESRYGMPGFRPLLERIAQLWAHEREDLLKDAHSLAEGLRRLAQPRPGRGLPGPSVFQRALEHLRGSFDPRWGGFGAAPKFPPLMGLELLLRRGTARDQAMVHRTLEAMADGGMCDQLGGGFARYSVDGRWLVPHFEKMLYDNALLASVYLQAHQAFGRDRYLQVARNTLDYLLRDLRDPEGGFHSAEDADSEGEEGRFYVWTPAQVAEVLGDRAAAFGAAYGVTPSGNFEHGTSVLHRFSAPQADFESLEGDRLRLLARRSQRPRPRKDDKVLVAWNGFALSALALGHRVTADPAYLEAAQACAAFLRAHLWKEGVLHRGWRQGRTLGPGFLEDYGALMVALVDLYETDFDFTWLQWGASLAEVVLREFEDKDEGGFFTTALGTPDLLVRIKAGHDQATPSGLTLAVQGLVRLGAHLQRPDFEAAAVRDMESVGAQLDESVAPWLGLLNAYDRIASPRLDLAALSTEGPETLGAALRAVWLGRGGMAFGTQEGGHPWLQDRPSGPGGAMLYLCEQGTCALPTSEAGPVVARLQAGLGGQK